jgi:Fe-S cluster assembly iron-binding protein IscA
MSTTQFNSELTNEINVSPEAIEQLIALTADEQDVNGVRIFVSGGGCGGMSYGMTLVEEPTQFDATWSKDGLPPGQKMA